jgi:hypothetical protein
MKLPFTFGIKFVFRIILPGFVLALGFLPIIRTIVDLTANVIRVDYAFGITALLLGWLIVVFDMPIYMAFEGRRYWPEVLRSFFKRRENDRLAGLQKTIDNMGLVTSETSKLRSRFADFLVRSPASLRRAFPLAWAIC